MSLINRLIDWFTTRKWTLPITEIYLKATRQDKVIVEFTSNEELFVWVAFDKADWDAIENAAESVNKTVEEFIQVSLDFIIKEEVLLTGQ